MARRLRWALGVLLAGGLGAAVLPARAAAPVKAAPGCSQVQFELEVQRGQSAERMFAQGRDGALKLAVQALASGWIVRVVPATGAWGLHDRAELATPPYLSPNPLLLTTDFAFRAQDAVAWNPRHFRYAASGRAFQSLLELYPKVLADDAAAMGEAARVSGLQPEGTVEILDATLAPGTADQWQMAAAVASHLDETPHQQAKDVAPSRLGTIVSLRLRLTLEVPRGLEGTAGLARKEIPCSSRPTT